MNNILRMSVVAILVLACTETALADAAAGKAKSAICMACHGMNGVSNNDIWPNLAGQKKGYLVNQIKAFRDGGRVDLMMAPMVKSLSDQDIDDLAEYYSKL
ncbi:MAG: cytochrome c [Pseudomonadales bacterium]|nr:cytochrome c [Pseudomonadales bacterium]